MWMSVSFVVDCNLPTHFNQASSILAQTAGLNGSLEKNLIHGKCQIVEALVEVQHEIEFRIMSHAHTHAGWRSSIHWRGCNHAISGVKIVSKRLDQMRVVELGSAMHCGNDMIASDTERVMVVMANVDALRSLVRTNAGFKATTMWGYDGCGLTRDTHDTKHVSFTQSCVFFWGCIHCLEVINFAKTVPVRKLCLYENYARVDGNESASCSGVADDANPTSGDAINQCHGISNNGSLFQFPMTPLTDCRRITPADLCAKTLIRCAV